MTHSSLFLSLSSSLPHLPPLPSHALPLPPSLPLFPPSFPLFPSLSFPPSLPSLSFPSSLPFSPAPCRSGSALSHFRRRLTHTDRPSPASPPFRSFDLRRTPGRSWSEVASPGCSASAGGCAAQNGSYSSPRLVVSLGPPASVRLERLTRPFTPHTTGFGRWTEDPIPTRHVECLHRVHGRRC